MQMSCRLATRPSTVSSRLPSARVRLRPPAAAAAMAAGVVLSRVRGAAAHVGQRSTPVGSCALHRPQMATRRRTSGSPLGPRT